MRSFDAQDADFFLDLLPGPRDRLGHSDSIRFWKTRIETQDARIFSVGLIYGPSGCGKSSLIRAGVLPRLANSVTAVHVEAAGEETEARLLSGLRRQLADLPTNLGLIESLAALRQRRFIRGGQKVLLVLDHFQQWLHSEHDEENTKLVQALRQSLERFAINLSRSWQVRDLCARPARPRVGNRPETRWRSRPPGSRAAGL